MLEFLGENEAADRIKEVCADPAVQVEGPHLLEMR